jgi:hypothetical protein
MSGDKNQKGGETPSSYPAAFLRAVEGALAQLGWQVVRWERGCVVCRSGEEGESSYGLDNLYRRARDLAPAAWQDLIVDHLRRVHEGTARALRSEDLHSVAHRILVRLGQPFTDKRASNMVWWRALEPGKLIVHLVIDHPETMSYVTRGMIQESGQPAEGWLEVALDNLRSRTSPDMLQPIGEDSGILLCCTNDAYDAARALILDRLLPEARVGALVAVPNRDRLMLMPIQAESLARLHLLKLVGRKSYEEAPYPISDEVYWVRGEEWTRIPIEFDEGTVRITAPEGFAEMLEELMDDRDPEWGE